MIWRLGTSSLQTFSLKKKLVFDSVSSHVLKIINTSLKTGFFPDVVKPLLKKSKLDDAFFLIKILEKMVSVQVQ